MRQIIIKPKIIINICIIQLLIWQVPLQNSINIFQYLDEVIAVYCFMIFFYKKVINRQKIDRRELSIIIAAVIILFLGMVGNMLFDVQKDYKAILMDIGNVFKFLVVFLGIRSLNYSKKQAQEIISGLARITRATVLIAFLFGVINLFININMHTDIVYGIRSYHFVFNRVGSFYFACIIFLTILTADLNRFKSTSKMLYIILTLITMCFTLRSRAVIFVVTYLAAYYILIIKKKVKINFTSIMIIILLCIYIALPKIQYYFVESATRARYVLVKYGLKTAIDFFPTGSGFATYGTFAAKQYYSPLYDEYSFYKYYGLSRDFGAFLTDSYWPGIIGQFGVFGAILMITIIVNLFKIIIRSNKNNKFLLLSSIFCFVVITINSLVSSGFLHFQVIGAMVVVGIVCKCND